MDTDTIVFAPLDQLWNHFNFMTDDQIGGLAYDNMDTTHSSTTYREKVNKRLLFVNYVGVNSGVMLMNLTRMRKVKFFNSLEPLVMKYHKNLEYFDQDLLNIYF